MLIRSTPQACFVILSNGLTLELCFPETYTHYPSNPNDRGTERVSRGVWLFHEEVLFEVRAGQA